MKLRVDRVDVCWGVMLNPNFYRFPYGTAFFFSGCKVLFVSSWRCTICVKIVFFLEAFLWVPHADGVVGLMNALKFRPCWIAMLDTCALGGFLI